MSPRRGDSLGRLMDATGRHIGGGRTICPCFVKDPSLLAKPNRGNGNAEKRLRIGLSNETNARSWVINPWIVISCDCIIQAPDNNQRRLSLQCKLPIPRCPSTHFDQLDRPGRRPPKSLQDTLMMLTLEARIRQWQKGNIRT